ncbi:MarR family winged helix-turn-helix transcriptional regulator [Pseudooceanicola atlanticus]|uniref:MarR family winged helix-turn-helix transcriptional regulator n=1 Tax=Pseudooceanicola atlanticus TaxID=1461694 RepID=UPI0023574529|nr:MarR family winged helix-turn-helix transcriptional regulator [Pseudooceanicola atlanticus]
MSDSVQNPDSPALAELLSGSCYCLATRRASRRMIRRYDAALAQHGLTISQLATLAWIRFLRRPSVQRIADLMEMDQSALSRGLGPLQREDLITTAPDPEDKRKKILSLTDAGEARLIAAAADWQKAQREVEAEQEKIGNDVTRMMAEINALAAPDEGP